GQKDLAMIGVAGTADEKAFDASGISTANSLIELLTIEPGDSVLEIGCGVGRIGKHLSARCGKWIGCDISGEMLRHARENLAAATNVEFIELTNSSLSAVESSSVQKVYCSAVFMHLDEWDRFRYVSEAFRVLAHGGMAYFDNINLAGDEGWSIFSKMSEYSELLRPPNISKCSTAEELTIYFERAGFSTIDVFPGSHWIAIRGIKNPL
ncbi:MAG: class I SAM-dependent methyltransferase, partial [Bdellovibrionales bacterium]|nr:class I SAM-dependent methyltransferase [Bdellovibrionales bacterium]